MYRICAVIVFICFVFNCDAQISKPGELRYLFENDTLIQKASIVFINKAHIAFTISTFNKKRKIESHFSDTAENKKPLSGTDNGKVIFDEIEGEMYGVLIYKYSKKFNLEIGVEKFTQKRLCVFEGDGSDKYHNVFCSFKSVGTLRRIERK